MSNKDTLDIVGVIVQEAGGRILLVEGLGHKWSFPKGRRKESETAHEAALREAREEAGIDLRSETCAACIKLKYGTYYVYQLAKKASDIKLESPSTPEEITQVAWRGQHSAILRAADKNADLRFFCQMK
jgi:8-oxo-dGTP pyrophosphatase MutT (NUDIX family)